MQGLIPDRSYLQGLIQDDGYLQGLIPEKGHLLGDILSGRTMSPKIVSRNKEHKQKNRKTEKKNYR